MTRSSLASHPCALAGGSQKVAPGPSFVMRLRHRDAQQKGTATNGSGVLESATLLAGVAHPDAASVTPVQQGAIGPDSHRNIVSACAALPPRCSPSSIQCHLIRPMLPAPFQICRISAPARCAYPPRVSSTLPKRQSKPTGAALLKVISQLCTRLGSGTNAQTPTHTAHTAHLPPCHAEAVARPSPNPGAKDQQPSTRTMVHCGPQHGTAELPPLSIAASGHVRTPPYGRRQCLRPHAPMP